MYQVLRSVMNAGFKAAGYSGVRSTPGIFVSCMDVYTHRAKTLCCAVGNKKMILQNMIGMCVRKNTR